MVFVRHGNVCFKISPCQLIKIENHCNSFNLKNYIENVSADSNMKARNNSVENCKKLALIAQRAPMMKNATKNNNSTNSTTEHVSQNRPHDNVRTGIRNSDNLKVSLKIGSIVKYREHDCHWKNVKLLGTGGKASGQYANFCNIKDTPSNETQMF